MRPIGYFLIITILCSSCAAVYVPPARNVPMLSKSGDFNGNASWGSSGFNVQSAYAVSNHLGVMANFQATSNSGNEKFRSHTAGDFGLGYYQRKKTAFEVFAGYGMGKGHGKNFDLGLSDQHTDLEGRYQRFYLQPSIGWYNKRLEWAVTGRVTGIYFDELNLKVDGVPTTVSKSPRYFFEPAFTLKCYFDDHFYFLTQGGICASFKANDQLASEDYDVQDHEPFQFLIGIGVKLSRK